MIQSANCRARWLCARLSNVADLADLADLGKGSSWRSSAFSRLSEKNDQST